MPERRPVIHKCGDTGKDAASSGCHALLLRSQPLRPQGVNRDKIESLVVPLGSRTYSECRWSKFPGSNDSLFSISIPPRGPRYV